MSGKLKNCFFVHGEAMPVSYRSRDGSKWSYKSSMCYYLAGCEKNQPRGTTSTGLSQACLCSSLPVSGNAIHLMYVLPEWSWSCLPTAYNVGLIGRNKINFLALNTSQRQDVPARTPRRTSSFFDLVKWLI